MKRRKVLIAAGIAVAVLVAAACAMPSILRAAGLHPHYPGVKYDLAGKRALIVTTSHGTLGDTGKATGVYASEMTLPYYEFLDAGMTVDVASIEGGAITIEPMSMKWPLMTEADKRFQRDPVYKAKVAASPRIGGLDFGSYDLVYLAGGWGASWDLGTSEFRKAQAPAARAFPEGLNAVPIGTGAPMGDISLEGACMAVVAGTRTFIVNAGEGSNRNLQHARIPSRPGAILLTHHDGPDAGRAGQAHTRRLPPFLSARYTAHGA